MHDIKYIRENPELFDANLNKRGVDASSKEILLIDNERRKLQTLIQEKQKSRNEISKKIPEIKSKGQDASSLFDQVSLIKKEISEFEKNETQLSEKLNSYLLELPNLIDNDLPIGTEEQNKLIKTWGTIKKYDFTPKDHVALGENFSEIDFPSAAKLSGSRFVILFGKIAKLERALKSFMIDRLTNSYGYTEVMPPVLVNEKTMTGTGQLPKFSEDLFKTIDNRWLIPTAEVPLTNIYRNKTIEQDSLPIKMTAHTPCFRAEAGSYGRDTRGMIRQHQFEKVELVKFVHPDSSEQELEDLVNDAASILDKLELSYRKVVLCTGDLGFSAAKTIDLEVWLPSQNCFREISSCSNFRDFQCRRMNTKAKDGKNKYFLHTLNGSGLAVGRTLLAILENRYEKGVGVHIPPVLKPFVNFEIIEIVK